MNYFDSDMSKSTITVVYFGRRQFIFTFADNIAHNLFWQIRACADDNSSTCTFRGRESQSHAPARVLMRLYQIDKSLVCLQSESHVRIYYEIHLKYCPV